MKFVFAVIAAVVTAFVVSIFLDETTRMSGNDIEVFGIWAGVAAAVLTLICTRDKNRSGADIVADAVERVADAKEAVEMRIQSHSPDLLAQAEREVESGEIDAGLWSQALVKAKGNEQLRKVEYMKLRAKQLKRQFVASAEE
jgi:hypothetical protein